MCVFRDPVANFPDKPLTHTVETVTVATKEASDFLFCITIYSTQLYLYNLGYSQDCL